MRATHPTEMAMLARLSSLVRPFAQAAAETIRRAVHKAPAPAAESSVRFFGNIVGAMVTAEACHAKTVMHWIARGAVLFLLDHLHQRLVR